jgi:hypothetical protein
VAAPTIEDPVAREMLLSELAMAADRADFADAKTLLLLQALRLRHPDLFY